MYFYVLLQWLSSSDQSCAYALVWIWLYSVPVLRRLRCNQPLDQFPFIRVAARSMNLYKKYHLFGTSAFDVFTVHICFPIHAWYMYWHHHTIWFPQIPAITHRLIYGYYTKSGNDHAFLSRNMSGQIFMTVQFSVQLLVTQANITYYIFTQYNNYNLFTLPWLYVRPVMCSLLTASNVSK